MSTLVFNCESCNSKLRIPAVHAGKRIRCPKCGHIQLASSPDSGESEGTAEFAALLAGSSEPQTLLPSSSPGTSARRRQDTDKSRVMWIAIGGGGAVLVLAVGLLLFFLWPREKEPPAPSQPAPATQAAAPPQQPPAPPEPAEPAQVSFGWYARYLPGEPAFLGTLRLGKVFNSQVFRQATAPVSPVIQMALLQVQQQLGMPLQSVEEIVLAISAADSKAQPQTSEAQGRLPIDFVIAGRASVPINAQLIFADAKSEQIAGQTVYVISTEQDNQAAEQPSPPGAPPGLGEQGPAENQEKLPTMLPPQAQAIAALQEQVTEVVAWLPDEKTVVVGPREVITRLIQRPSEVTVTASGDLALALSQVDSPGDADFLIGASSEIVRLAAPLASGLPGGTASFGAGPGTQGGQSEMQPSGPPANTPPQPTGFPGQPPGPSGPGGAPAATGLPGFGGGSGSPLPLPTKGALAISARAGNDLAIRAAIVSQDDVSAGQMQQQLSGLQQMLMFQLQSTLQQLQQQAAAQAQPKDPTQQQTAPANPLQQQTLQKEISGLQKFIQAIQQATVEGHGRTTTVRISIPGDALAALVISAMQAQQKQQGQQGQPGGPPGGPGFGPPGFPGAPPGFPRGGPAGR